jgi:hypothetical protein
MCEVCGCEGSVHGHRKEHIFHEMCHCGCGGRRFQSRKEKIEMLEDYRRYLKNELEGVEEELKSLNEEISD